MLKYKQFYNGKIRREFGGALMKIIISPAKKMNVVPDVLPYEALPIFIDRAEQLKEELRRYSLPELQKLFVCNEKIARLNYERYRNMDLYQMLSPAILSYEGIQYQYMAPVVFTDQELAYVQKHLRILSGFYGILKPMDGVVPYRLEMQAKLRIGEYKNLYEYWNRRIYEELVKEEDLIINLASKEYSKVIETYLTPDITYINCVFGKLVNGKVKVSGTYAKMARGEMVRFMAQNQIFDLYENFNEYEKRKEYVSHCYNVLRSFQRLGYCFEESLSSRTQLVFLQK